jgi:hypothetical protein
MKIPKIPVIVTVAAVALAYIVEAAFSPNKGLWFSPSDVLASSAVQRAPTPVTSEDPQAAPGKWIVDRVLCMNLLNASDDDQASVAMFYYGYLAAQTHIRAIDVTKISRNIEKVMQRCSERPGLTVPQAFRDALPGE